MPWRAFMRPPRRPSSVRRRSAASAAGACLPRPGTGISGGRVCSTPFARRSAAADAARRGAPSAQGNSGRMHGVPEIPVALRRRWPTWPGLAGRPSRHPPRLGCSAALLRKPSKGGCRLRPQGRRRRVGAGGNGPSRLVSCRAIVVAQSSDRGRLGAARCRSRRGNARPIGIWKQRGRGWTGSLRGKDLVTGQRGG